MSFQVTSSPLEPKWKPDCKATVVMVVGWRKTHVIKQGSCGEMWQLLQGVNLLNPRNTNILDIHISHPSSSGGTKFRTYSNLNTQDALKKLSLFKK